MFYINLSIIRNLFFLFIQVHEYVNMSTCKQNQKEILNATLHFLQSARIDVNSDVIFPLYSHILITQKPMSAVKEDK